MRIRLIIATLATALLAPGILRLSASPAPASPPTPAPTTLPAVEDDYNVIRGAEAAGKPLSQVVKADAIDRIVLFERSGQLNLQKLLAAVFAEDPQCQGWGLSATERPLSRLVLLAKGGRVFFLQIVGDTLAREDTPSAILIHGKGFGLRVALSDKAKAAAAAKD